ASPCATGSWRPGSPRPRPARTPPAGRPGGRRRRRAGPPTSVRGYGTGSTRGGSTRSGSGRRGRGATPGAVPAATTAAPRFRGGGVVQRGGGGLRGRGVGGGGGRPPERGRRPGGVRGERNPDGRPVHQPESLLRLRVPAAPRRRRGGRDTALRGPRAGGGGDA